MKKRLDVLICENNPDLSRSKAQSLIMSGVVYVDNQKETKCGAMFPSETIPEIRGESLRYVSRGGLKLEKAISSFDLDLSGKVCMDIGASTGGFTDCMLKNGASKVYSVDVGKGQLDWKLRNDPRVIVMERTNIRYVKPEDIADTIDFISIDVSFISLTLVVPVAISLLNNNKEMVMLIKPQFEAGREKVGKKGVVRDPEVHKEVIKKVIDHILQNSLTPEGLDYSPVKGPEGNIEYLLHVSSEGYDEKQILDNEKKDIKKNVFPLDDIDGKILKVVSMAHEELDK